MNDNPWLSIIVPVYNAAQYIDKCIRSILMQSFSDFELIVVDDGSTDASGSICREYVKKDSRVRYYLKENGGSIQSRVFGIERSAGDYFTFCDADDYYVSANAFEKIFEEISREDCDVLQFNYIKKFNHLFSKVNLGSRYLADYGGFYNTEYPKLLCSHWKEARLTPNVWNKVYSKELKNKLPSYDFFERVFWGDDLIMNLYLLEDCESVLFIPDYLYIYRQFSGGTSRFMERTMYDLDRIKKYQLRFIDRYKGNRKKEIVNTCFMEITGWFFFYIRQGLNSVSEKHIKELINESLQLPNFKKAQEYFKNESAASGELVELFKLADAERYIEKAKQKNSKKSVKDDLISILKKIYKTI